MSAEYKILIEMRYYLLLVIASFIGLSGCASNPSGENKASASLPDSGIAAVGHETTDPEPDQQLTPAQHTAATGFTPTDDVWSRLNRGYALADIKQARIDREIKRFQQYKPAFSNMLEQARPYLSHILREVEKRQMPAEIALLPAVESGFRPYAYSPDGAAGLWQFMPATGKHYGLKQDWWYDARRDPLASTDAALDYLEHLHKRFADDWLLALAAYNAGGGRVARAVRKNTNKGLPIDFWSLDLPKETDNYVPRLLALAAILRDPDAYGLALPEIGNDPQFVAVDTGGQLDLGVAARIAGVDPEELLKLNAGCNRWATHPEGPHRLLLPLDANEDFSGQLAELPDAQRMRWKRYRIRSGDTLSQIAQQHGVSVQALKQANKLSSSRIRAGKHLMIPLSQSVTSLVAVQQNRLPRSRVRYQVREGDSLYRIARQFRVKVADLKQWNSLNGRYIHPGQSLVVLVDPARQTL